jgi:hypothetical protein
VGAKGKYEGKAEGPDRWSALDFEGCQDHASRIYEMPEVCRDEARGAYRYYSKF